MEVKVGQIFRPQHSNNWDKDCLLTILKLDRRNGNFPVLISISSFGKKQYANRWSIDSLLANWELDTIATLKSKIEL